MSNSNSNKNPGGEGWSRYFPFGRKKRNDGKAKGDDRTGHATETAGREAYGSEDQLSQERPRSGGRNVRSESSANGMGSLRGEKMPHKTTAPSREPALTDHPAGKTDKAKAPSSHSGHSSGASLAGHAPKKGHLPKDEVQRSHEHSGQEHKNQKGSRPETSSVTPGPSRQKSAPRPKGLLRPESSSAPENVPVSRNDLEAGTANVSGSHSRPRPKRVPQQKKPSQPKSVSLPKEEPIASFTAERAIDPEERPGRISASLPIKFKGAKGRPPLRDFELAPRYDLNSLPAVRPGSKKGKKKTSPLKIIPLGGLEQIGMNITAFEYEDSIVVVDCGLSFPEDDMLGIDLVIPDVTYLKENISKVKGFVITHGHEDHIGALPYVLRDINVPIYSTRLTLALISNKLQEHNLTKQTKLKEVKHGQVINLGDFAIEFIKTNHSIQDASALAIYSPVGIVVHTGDFKVDYTPVFGDAIDLQRLAEIGKKGVLALMCDSTNAEKPGFTMSERTVGRVFDNLFNEYKTSRIIIATFASNVDRVQQIINTAYRFGRKVAVEGRSMVNVISTAADLGYIRIPDQTLIEIDQVKNYPDEQVVLITTGSQGESMAALSRMAASIHKKITIKPNDAIIFSSHPIPGNEKAVSKVINELSMKGAKVIFQDAHVSGHACQEEIKLIYSLVRPRYAIPVHGEYRHLTAQKHVVEELGIPEENIFILSSGNVLELNGETAKVTGSVHTGAILVDGLGVGDVGNIVLRDRQRLAEDGIMIVVMTLERYSNSVLSGPDIVSRGFVYVRESEDLMEHAREAVQDALDSCIDKNVTDWGRIKTEVKDALSDYVWKRTKRSPMILPIIMEA